MNKMIISAEFPYESHFIEIDGANMHYITQGEGAPILFLHGIPASSYVWRNVIPHLAMLGCCIAPDLVGFGKSAKPDIAYSIKDHIQYIEKFITALKLEQITFVMHGWGSIIGFDYIMRHENKCRGVVFYEAYLHSPFDHEIPLPYQEQIVRWQAEANLKSLLTDSINFIDQVIPQSVMRALSEKEMNYYREPFKQQGSGKPLYQYLHELPHGSGSSKINQLIQDYSKKLAHSTLPKLMLYSVPGFITTLTTAIWAKTHFPNLEIMDVGEELHYAQESNPILMGEAISIWLQSLEQQFKK